MLKVSGIGQCSIDYISLIDEFPAENTKLQVTPYQTFGGGPVATALVTLSRLGVKTKFIGVISDDDAGALIKREFIKEGVDISHIIEILNKRSQTAFILVNNNNGRRTIFWSKPTAEIQNAEVPKDFILGSSLLHLDGYLFDIAIPALIIAKKNNISVMIDIGSFSEQRYDIVKLCDYVVCSEVFSDALCQGDHEKTLKKLIENGTIIATVTLGSRGSLTAVGNKIFHQPAYVVKAVDTTGAGDVFHGGYIYGLINKWDIVDTLKFASASAAIKCLKLGGRDGIADLETVKDFINKKNNF
ncbi:MAG: sugar kinase [Nitrospirae bacterium]|nr:sugar kinase [Nitrospirota bacterium]